LVPIDFSYTTSYRLSIVTFALACTLTLVTIHNVTDDDNDRRNTVAYGRKCTATKKTEKYYKKYKKDNSTVP